MKRVFLFLFIVLMPLFAGAQNLVVYDADVLANKPDSPHYAVLTEKYFNSLEWDALAEKIERFGVAHAFDGGDQAVGDPDWDEYERDLEKTIAEYTRAGNEEAAQMFRKSLEESKKMRAELEAQSRELRAQTRGMDEGLDRDELREELLKHTVGGRFFYSAEIYLDRLACVQARSVDDDQNVFGLMDAQGQMVVPARPWTSVRQGNNVGMIDTLGVVRIPVNYPYLSRAQVVFYRTPAGELAAVRDPQTRKWGFIGRDAAWVVKPFTSDEPEWDEEQGCFVDTAGAQIQL